MSQSARDREKGSKRPAHFSLSSTMANFAQVPSRSRIIRTVAIVCLVLAVVPGYEVSTLRRGRSATVVHKVRLGLPFSPLFQAQWTEAREPLDSPVATAGSAEFCIVSFSMALLAIGILGLWLVGKAFPVRGNEGEAETEKRRPS